MPCLWWVTRWSTAFFAIISFENNDSKSTIKRNLFTCQSAVNYRMNLCKANKVKKRAVLVLTLHKEYGIVIMHRISRYSSAWFVCALQKRKMYVSSVVGLLPFGGLDQLCIAQAESVFQPSVCLLCQEWSFFIAFFNPEEEKQCNIPSKNRSTTFCAW